MAEPYYIPEGLISETKSFDSKTSVTSIVPAIKRYEAVIVNNEKGYYGIIDSRTVYKSFQSLSAQSKDAADKYTVKVPRITDATPIDDVVYYFAKSRVKALPYMKDGKTVGVLRRSTLLKVLLSLGKLAGMTVSEAMVSPLIGIDVDATVTQAKTAMRDNKINRIAVMDRDRLLGIVTNYDFFDRYFRQQERLPQRKSDMFSASNIRLDSVVNRNVRMIDSTRGLSDAVREMIENKVSSLVVTKGSKPIGILTELDVIVSVMAKSQAATNRIFISGLTPETYEYEDEIRETLDSFLSKIERLKNVKVEYVSLVVRKFKTKSYELHARLALSGKSGIINKHVEGHIFERTLAQLLDLLAQDVQKNKEKYLSVRKVLHNAHPEEEVE
ncbi:MAG: CBS domain-containing protein [Candidatus Micrarchaeales archaeon]|nr:CBS domain-containing protein [Candidatus Micrarchaeales archaeon]